MVLRSCPSPLALSTFAHDVEVLQVLQHSVTGTEHFPLAVLEVLWSRLGGAAQKALHELLQQCPALLRHDARAVFHLQEESISKPSVTQQSSV